MRLNRTDELINAHEFPATTEELIEAYGDQTIEHPNGSEQLGDVFARAGFETYTCADDARNALLCGLGHEAIGRRYYSDRDVSTFGEDGPQQVSF
ncbi:DUF2795 domain-containing protein [Halogeometricum borinquense]|uniref:DUF2795 domain-containing protein n=2 Tax=Halogeometricum borinquense TaxID=60847 RepID=E4NS56_HALBP|nr:hypothetical protein [Halogeometricum borinquense]ADQ65741.1 hypothetical protein Hbor_01300 [Halogeometricum borinquense DSM 11551]ELY26745.1 hypothetical protein C499_11081 [Halogeometricum borinquense DSM 11551]QIB72862.1 DUF2795 domain-containing protein [Halogeometricum borinquense]QIQ75179.1 DUF2795 domain-containing protein [Halogeometricum borinquense]RYJ15075.1 DUF2795 domain-containing protein [Halogeometricum borinquense]